MALVGAAAVLLAAAPADNPPSPDANSRVGVRFQALPEGAVVLEVIPGMGASRAGVVPGDLVLSVDGAELGADVLDARARFRGAPGTFATVRVRGPWGSAERELQLQRGLPRAPAPDEAAPHEAVETFWAAMRRGGKGTARNAAQALVDADFGGLPPEDAVAVALRAGMRRKPAVAMAAVEVFERLPLAAQDPDFAYRLAEVAWKVRDLERTVRFMQTVVGTRVPDATLGEHRVDLGGRPWSRKVLAQALQLDGQAAPALRVVERLERTRELDRLRSLMDLGPGPESATWSVRLPPIDEIELALLDGREWRLSDQRGKVVVLNFWATWCGPCKKELPDLAAMYPERVDAGLEVVAVSVDRADLGDKVAAYAEQADLPFAVAHSPALGRRFDIDAIPAMRVLDRRGGLARSERGYSPLSFPHFVDSLDVLLAADAEQGAALGEVRGTAVPILRSWSPLAGAADVHSDGSALVVALEQAAPVLVGPGGVPEPDVTDGAGSGFGRVVWNDGAVTANEGGFWVRAWTTEGAQRWFTTVPAPIRDLAVLNEHLVVSTRAGVFVLDADGQVVATLADVDLRDLAPGPDGLWAVDGQRRWWLRFAGGALDIEDRGAAPKGRRVGPGGQVGTGVVGDLVVGRFGPDGAPRMVVARTDGAVIGVDGGGAPAFVLQLADEARITAHDRDGDGQDELIVSVRHQGVATLETLLP